MSRRLAVDYRQENEVVINSQLKNILHSNEYVFMTAVTLIFLLVCIAVTFTLL